MKKTIMGLVIALNVTFIPTVTADEGKTLYCQGMVCSETPPAPESFAGFAVVDNSGKVHGVISCSIEHCPKTLEGQYMGCTNCSLVQQTPGNKEGNAYGYSSSGNTEVTLNKQTNTWSVTTTDAAVPVLVNGVQETVTAVSTTTYTDLIKEETKSDIDQLLFNDFWGIEWAAFFEWFNTDWSIKNIFTWNLGN